MARLARWLIILSVESAVACILIWQGYRWLMDDVWAHISASEALDTKIINSVIAGSFSYLALVTGVLAMASFILVWNREE